MHCSRAARAQSATVRTCVRTATRTGPSQSLDFIQSRPRRSKGKEKASEVPHNTLQLEQVLLCQNWFSVLRQTLQCQAQFRHLLLQEFSILPQNLTITSYRINPPVQRLHPFTNHVPIHQTQRRHVSNALHRQPPPLDVQVDPPLGLGREIDSNTSTPLPIEIQRLHSLLDAPSFHPSEYRAAFDLVCRLHAGLVTSADVRIYVQKMLSHVETFYAKSPKVDHMKEWGASLEDVLTVWQTRLVSSEGEGTTQLEYDCLFARAIALAGHLRRATVAIHDIMHRYGKRAPDLLEVQQVYQSIIQATGLYYGATFVLDFIALEWANIGSHLGFTWGKGFQAGNLALRRAAFATISAVDEPRKVLEDHSRWETKKKQIVGDLLVAALAETGRPLQALPILQRMPDMGLQVTIFTRLHLVEALIKVEAFEPAAVLFAECPEDRHKFYLAVGLDLYGRMGDNVRAEYFYEALVEAGLVSAADRGNLLYSYAQQGDVEKTIETFDRFYPLASPSSPNSLARLNAPGDFEYGTIIYACSQRGDLEGVRHWYSIMKKANRVILRRSYNLVVKCLTQRSDLESALGVLDEMRKTRSPPDCMTYTMIITLLAHRRDPERAERVYKRALREGVVPDRAMTTALMNAHVEGGSWHGVIRSFDYLSNLGNSYANMTIEVFNTLLKAYVMIGAPFRTVSQLYDRLVESRVQPDEYTYAFLVQSACDSCLLDVASTICQDVESKMYENVNLNTYLLTILMAGYLRTGRKTQAQATYNRMINRGLKPTAVTFNHIVRAYGNEQNEDSFEIAEKFIQELLETPQGKRTWDVPEYGGKQTLEQLYGPLLSQYARARRLEDVERVIQDLLDQGIKLSIGPLTSLLNVYRKTFNIQSVEELWPKIFELGLSQVNALPEDQYPEDEVEPESKFRPDMLSIPLSIYIDALSAAGRHTKIAAVWTEYQKHGFNFTSHNWNHLIVALVRAAEFDRAFEVLERVIIPYQIEANRMESERDTDPTSPLALSKPTKVPQDDQLAVPPGSEEEVVPSPEVSESLPGQPKPKFKIQHESPLHNARARDLAAFRGGRKLESLGRQDLQSESPDDLAHPLHVLHSISPSWDVWRPHLTTLSVMLQATIRLRAGIVPKPILPGSEDSEVLDADVEDTPRPTDEGSASEILQRLAQRYPAAMAQVVQHESFERQRLKSQYNRVYFV